MKNLGFALAAAATFALTACGGGNEDAVEEPLDQEVGTQGDQLNALADEAANRVEAEALGTQQEQLQEEVPAEEATGAADVQPTENPDEDVAGM